LALTEVALATMLAIGTSLLFRSYSDLSNQDLGFRTEGVVRIGLFVNEIDVPEESGLQSFRERVRETVMSEPGVRGMGIFWPTVPIDWAPRGSFSVSGIEPELSERHRLVDFFVVDPQAFETLDMDLVSPKGSSQHAPGSGSRRFSCQHPLTLQCLQLFETHHEEVKALWEDCFDKTFGRGGP